MSNCGRWTRNAKRDGWVVPPGGFGWVCPACWRTHNLLTKRDPNALPPLNKLPSS